MPAEHADQVFLDAAFRHRLLTESQVEAVAQMLRDDPKSNARQLAIREGYLNARHLDALKCLESPKDVAPGYVVQKILGTGGFGNVFMAQQMNLSRTVALKTIQLSQLSDPTSRKRFEREAKIVGQLRHPNIVAAFDFGMHHERLFLSMEYVKGLDADHLVEQHGPLSPYVAWQIIKQVSMALAYAAEQDVIHRDVKPGNLLLTQAPTGYHLPSQIPLVKVADFGLACFSETSLRNNKLTAENSAVGTPFYVAPEQLSDSEVDERADIYSLGITAWQLISGTPPMQNLSPMKIVMKKLGGDEGWLDALPKQLEGASGELIRQMCAHDPAQRIPDHGQLLQRIEHVLESLDNSQSTPAETRSMDLTALIESAEASNQSFITRNSFDDVTQEFSSVEMAEPTLPPSAVVEHSASIPLATKFAIPVTLLGLVILAVLFQDKILAVLRPQINLNTLPRLVELGEPIFLFTGTAIPRQKSTGPWKVDSDRDKGRVMAGNGLQSFACEKKTKVPLHYFQFSCGFRHHEATEIQFEITQGSQSQKVLVNLENAKWSEGPIENGTELKAELRKFGSETLGYHQILIERQPGYALAIVDGMPLGRVPFEDVSTAHAIEANQSVRINVTVLGTGMAHFERIFVSELTQIKAKQSDVQKKPGPAS